MKRIIAVVAVFGMLAASQAIAADKLIVQPATGTTNVLNVTDSGPVGINFNTPKYSADVANQGGVSTSELHFSMTGADNGGYITSVAENNFYISSGASFEAGSWIQKAADGKSVFFGSGAAGFTAYLNQGATVGGPVTASPKFRVQYDGKMGIGTLTPTQQLEVNGGVRLNTATAKPTCDANARGTIWFTAGAGTAADALEVCSQAAGGALAWRALY